MTLHNDDTKSPLVRLGTRAEDYERLGLRQGPVEQFEDGLRTDPQARGVFEWWYFDTHLEDGAKLVVMFATKNSANPNTGLEPFLSINLDLPDGRSLARYATLPAEEFSASSQGCDVRIGDNEFCGDLHTYRIKATVEEISVDVTLTGTVPAWRPATGHSFFGRPGHEKYFAWVPAVPNGRVEATYQVGGEPAVHVEGVGYHDHNWGDAPMMSLMHDWYWGRAQVGPYSLIVSYITAEKKYDYGSQTSFLLARGNEVVADDAGQVTFSTDQVHTDSETGKPVADVFRFDYEKNGTRYLATFERKQTILRTKFIEALPRAARLLARLARFNGCYLRFVGTLTLQHYENGELVEELSEEKALWELMYFGHPRTPAA